MQPLPSLLVPRTVSTDPLASMSVCPICGGVHELLWRPAWQSDLLPDVALRLLRALAARPATAAPALAAQAEMARSLAYRLLQRAHAQGLVGVVNVRGRRRLWALTDAGDALVEGATGTALARAS